MNKSLVGPICTSIACLLGIIVIGAGTSTLWHPGGLVLVSGAKQLVPPLLLFAILGLVLSRKNPLSLQVLPELFVLGLVWVFITSWLFNPFGLAPAPSSRGVILFATLLSSIIYYQQRAWNWSLLAIGLLLILIVNFINESAGRIITSDDHATFLHRLMLLRDNFFNIPVYDPHWNAGYDQRYFFATGSLNVFLLTLPLTYFFPPTEVYNFCFIFVALILPFFSVYFASRILGLSVNTAWIACILSLAPCAAWFRWTFNCGTLGFVTSTALLPLNLALSIRILNTKEPFPLPYALLLIITFSLMLFWSMSGVVFLPVILIALYKIFASGLLRKNYVSFVLLALILINLPWVVTFLSVSKVGSFLKAEKTTISASTEVPQATTVPVVTRTKDFKHQAGGIDLRESLKKAREFASGHNPLLLFLILPGLLLLKPGIRAPWILTSIWLCGFGLLLYPVKPQLELERFLIIFALISVIPTALAIEKILQPKVAQEKLLLSMSRLACVAITAGYLIAIPLSANAIVNHQTSIPYTFQSNFTSELIHLISRYKLQGRVLFSGMIMHEIDGGHLAAIPEQAKTPVVARTFVHNEWSYRQVFPESVLANKDLLIPEFLAAYNIAAVFAHEPKWIHYFHARPDLYGPREKIGRFQLFDYLPASNSYFISGSGEILEQNNHSVKLKLNEPQATIKFRYFPFLETNSSCKLSPKLILEDLEVIELSECPTQTEIIIKSKPAWKRI